MNAVLRSGLLTYTKLIRAATCVRLCQNPYMEVVYLTKKAIPINRKQFSLDYIVEVERPKRSTTFSFFRYFTR